MSVYFGKMSNQEQCDNHQCVCDSGDSYFGTMQPNDYVFIRLASDGAKISRLWKLDRIENSNGQSIAYFDDVFSFNSITTERLGKLKLFKIDVNSVVNIMKTQRGLGFSKLSLTDEEMFNNCITNRTVFDAFCADDNNCRKIVFVEDESTAKSDIDVQIIKDGDTYKIYNDDKDFLSGLKDKFDPNRYLEFCDFLNKNLAIANSSLKKRTQKKTKRWVESKGNGEITLSNLWDLFCSKVQFKDDEDNEYENEEKNEHKNNSLEKDKNKNINMKTIITNYIDADYKQIILTGAPGTGKTYSVKTVCEAICNGDLNKISFVQFHPSYDYSDFVEGLRPVMITKGGNPTFVRLDGIFKSFCRKVVEANYKKKTGNDFGSINGNDTTEKYKKFIEEYATLEEDQNFESDKYFFIIDEINRADLSKVFGELMYCLEDSYRGLQGKTGKNLINTQYSNLPTYTVENGIGKELVFDCFKEGFFIPKNIYIIGTMNDIDRSVESFDFALRRRFEWVEIKANEVFFEAVKEMLGLNDDEANKLKNKVASMNNVISSENNPFMLTEAYHIGHAYFKNYDPKNENDSLEKIFDTNITSILKEYTRGRNGKYVEENLIQPCRKKLLGDE